MEDFTHYEGLLDRMEVLIDRLHYAETYAHPRRRELYKKLAHRQLRYLRGQIMLLT